MRRDYNMKTRRTKRQIEIDREKAVAQEEALEVVSGLIKQFNFLFRNGGSSTDIERLGLRLLTCVGDSEALDKLVVR